jgi:hypothetical protein
MQLRANIPSLVSWALNRVHIALCLWLWLASFYCAAAWSSNAYTLDGLLDTTSKLVQISIPTNGLIQVGIVRLSTNAPSQVSLEISPFRGESDGQELDVRLVQTNLTFPSNRVFAPALLQVPQVRVAQKYRGLLALSAIGEPPVIWQVAVSDLNLSRPATLIMETGTLKYPIIEDRLRSWFRPPETNKPQVTVGLNEKTGALPIEGLGVSLISITAPERVPFDLTRNVTIFMGTNRVPALTESAFSSAANLHLRRIPVGGHTRLGFAFHGLKPGNYVLELKVFALNLPADPPQKLTITLQKSHSVWPPLLVLLLALGVSFFSYKWLKLYSQRLPLRKTINDLRPGWLSYREPVYSVVWVRTVLKQAERIACRIFSLIPPSLITERIDRVRPTLLALEEAGKTERYIEPLPRMAKHRFKGVIDGHIRSISDSNMDKGVAAKAREALAALNDQLAAGKWLDSYRAEIEKAMSAFLRVYDESSLPLSDPGIPRKAELEARRNTLLSLTDEAAITAVDIQYAKAKTLFECRRYKDRFPELLAIFDQPIDDLFALADDIVWKHVQSVPLRIQSAQQDINEPLEAFSPLKFFVTTGDRELDATYLFNRGLHFRWHCTLQCWPLRTKHFQPLSHSPRVVQFAPHSGKLTVSVEILRNEPPSDEPENANPIVTCARRIWAELKKKVSKSPSPAPPLQPAPPPPPAATLPTPKVATMRPLTVARSSDVGFVRGLEVTEWCALLIAALFAIISGLLTFYYKNPIFGSIQDYLGLFLWGVGVEQTKNFLQALQSRDSTP